MPQLNNVFKIVAFSFRKFLLGNSKVIVNRLKLFAVAGESFTKWTLPPRNFQKFREEPVLRVLLEC